MKPNRQYSLCLVLLTLIALLAAGRVCAATFTSVQSGNWTDGSTWGGPPGNSPTCGDTVIISAGHVVTLDIDHLCSGDLTVNGTLDMANHIFYFRGATFTHNGALICSVGTNGVFDFDGVGGQTGTTQTLAGSGTCNTNGVIDYEISSNGTTVTPANGAVLNGLRDFGIENGATALLLSSDFVVNGLTGSGQTTISGPISGNGILKTNKNVAISSAAMSAPLEVVTGTTAAAGVFSGTITIDSGATVTLPFNTVLTVNGNLTVNGTLDMNNRFLAFQGPTFTNNGALINSNGFGGLLDFNGVNGQANTTQILAGTGTCNTNGVIDYEISPGITVTPANGAVLNGLGNFTFANGSVGLVLSSDFVVTGLTGSGQTAINGGTISGNGILKTHNNVAISGSPMSAPLEVVTGTTAAAGVFGTITIDNGATVTLPFNTILTVNGNLTVNGTLDMNNRYLAFQGPTFTNNGALISSLGNGGAVDFYGVNGASGTTQALAGSGSYNTGGSIGITTYNSTTVASTSSSVLEGVVSNTMLSGSTWLNNGTMEPGFPPGQANISGNLQLGSTSTLAFKIKSVQSGNPYDSFTDGSTLALNGALLVRLVGNFTPNSSDVYSILTAQGTVAGALTNVPSGQRLATVDQGGSFLVTYAGQNNVTLSQFSSLVPAKIDTVVIRNPGNATDSTGYGAVRYPYSIGKSDVTLNEYAAFLNAVAASDPHSLYNPSLATDLNIAGISRSGSDGSYTYSVIGDGTRPVTYVTWFNAARFANWLNNGEPTGLGEVAASTETGAYTLNGAMSGVFTKNAGAVWWIPSEDEWYKAAYYDPTLNAGAGGYWLYPTQSNSAPGNMIGSSTNQANYRANGFFSVTQSSTYSGSQNYVTPDGSFTGSASAYGTYDQGGDVFQWNDAVITNPSARGARGGSWASNLPDFLQSSYRAGNDPTSATSSVGFRVATSHIPAVLPTSAFSTKTHPTSPPFVGNIPLPLSGAVGVEGRTGGTGGNHQLLVNFANPVTVTSVSATPDPKKSGATASVGSVGVSGSQVTVNLTNVSNAQTITVTLSGVSDGIITNDVTIPMGVLIGDVNGNGVVSNTDVSLVKAQVTAPVGSTNFREDVNANGVISNTDVSLTKAQVGTTLP